MFTFSDSLTISKVFKRYLTLSKMFQINVHKTFFVFNIFGDISLTDDTGSKAMALSRKLHA